MMKHFSLLFIALLLLSCAKSPDLIWASAASWGTSEVPDQKIAYMSFRDGPSGSVVAGVLYDCSTLGKKWYRKDGKLEISGKIISLNRDGYVYFIDRKLNLINTGVPITEFEKYGLGLGMPKSPAWRNRIAPLINLFSKQISPEVQALTYTSKEIITGVGITPR